MALKRKYYEWPWRELKKYKWNRYIWRINIVCYASLLDYIFWCLFFFFANFLFKFHLVNVLRGISWGRKRTQQEPKKSKHFPLACLAEEGLLCLFAQSCHTLWPLDCGPPGPSVPGILQAGMLGWVTMPFSRGSSQPRIQRGLLHCRQIL